MFAFAIECAADGGEGFGEREDVARDEHIVIFCSDRMPVNALSRNRDFRH